VPFANGSATENITETELWLPCGWPCSYSNRFGFRKQLKIKLSVLPCPDVVGH
jgi:hypothetical protein